MANTIPKFSARQIITDLYAYIADYFGRTAKSDYPFFNIYKTGPWDMQTDPSFTIELVGEIENITVIHVGIHSVVGDVRETYSAGVDDGLSEFSVSYDETTNKTEIKIERTPTGVFNDPKFSDTNINRATVQIWSEI